MDMEKGAQQEKGLKGHCFLCMDNLKLDSSRDPLQHLSTYLKLDMVTIFGSLSGDGVPVPEQLLSSRDKEGSKSKWAISLCQECSRVNRDFLKVLGQLHQIELEMTNCLQRIHRKLARSEGICRNELFEKVSVSPSPSQTLVMDLNLRKEVIQKCSRKICQLLANVHQQPESADFANLQNLEDQQHDIVIKTEPPPETADESYHDLEPLGSSDNVDGSLSDMGSDTFSNSRVDEDIDNVTSEAGQKCEENDSRSESEPSETSAPTSLKKKRPYKTRRRPQNPRGSFNPKSGRYSCKICGKELANSYNLKLHHEGIHLKKVHQCPHCDKSFNHSTSVDSHVKNVHQNVRYTCQKCNKKFTRSTHLSRHRREINCLVKIRRCHLCPEEFTCTTGLRDHLKSAHSTILRDFVCHLCGNGYSERYELQEHINSIHLKLIENVCEHCGKNFSTPRKLQRHVQSIHLAERKTVFECETCGKKFPRSCHLSRHQRSYHSGTGNQPKPGSSSGTRID